MGRRRTPRMPGLNLTHHTLAKIKRIGLRHRKSPPTGSESYSHPPESGGFCEVVARLVRQHEGDLIQAGLSEAAGRLSAMAKVPALGMRLRHQGLERGAEHDGCGGGW